MEIIFRAEGEYLERQLVRLVGPRVDMTDLLQMTYMAAIEAFTRFRKEAAVRTWLTRIAVNVASAHLRKPERTRCVSLELLDGAEPRANTTGPHEAALARARLERLYHHLSAIGARKRIAFILHVVDGKPVQEVAALMEATVMATKSRIFWARRTLVARARRDPALSDMFSDDEGNP